MLLYFYRKVRYAMNDNRNMNIFPEAAFYALCGQLLRAGPEMMKQ